MRANACVKEPRSRDSGNTVRGKAFPDGILVATGANSAVGLCSMPLMSKAAGDFSWEASCVAEAEP